MGEGYEAADVHDERALMGVVAGAMWLACVGLACVGVLLPGSPREHRAVVLGIAPVVALYGLLCLTRRIDWRKVSLEVNAAVSVVLYPTIGITLWATGGAGSFVELGLFPAVLFAAWFFPPAYAYVLVAELGLVLAAPLLYDPNALAAAQPARVLMFTSTTLGCVWVTKTIKQRLVEAERAQRRLAAIDPLTGVANRRAFERALREAVAEAGEGRSTRRRPPPVRPAAALVLLDLDGFKQVNDALGHPAGDELLREVARRCRELVQGPDTLARIGGDEFAVVLPGCGPQRATRVAAALEAAIATIAAPSAEVTVGATAAWAAAPGDGGDAEALLTAADHRLLDAKRAHAWVGRPGDARRFAAS